MDNTFQKFSYDHISGYYSVGGQLQAFLTEKQLKMLDAADIRRQQVDSEEALHQYAAHMKKRFLEELGGLPDMDVPLNGETAKVTDMGSYIREDVLYQARDRVYVTASLYLPKNLKEPAPAVLFLCGHFNEARMADNYQDVCQTLVSAGLVVFAVDTLGQGERMDFYDRETGEYLTPYCVPDHDYCGIPGIATGRFLESYMVSDYIRAVDYMLTRKEIDPRRIGVTGNSGGGLQTMCVMVCDDRVAAAAPATFVTNRREIHNTWMIQDAEQIWPSAEGYCFDHPDCFAVFAPKPTLILAAKSDFFPIEGTRETYEEAKRLYGLLGKQENIRLFEDDYHHYYTPRMARKAANFFLEVFGWSKGEISDETVRVPFEDMYATKSGNVKGDRAEARMAIQEARDLAAEQKKRRLSMDRRERLQNAKDWLRQKTAYGRDPVDFNPRMFDQGMDVRVGDYTGIGMCWWVQKRLSAYGMVISKSTANRVSSLPTVIAIWPEGTRNIARHEAWIRGHCDSGRQVLILDLPGMGNAEKSVIGGDAREYCGLMYRQSSDLLLMGDSMSAMQCYHVLRSVDMLRDCLGIPEEDITLYCEGQEGCYGILAGFLLEKVRMEYGENLLKNVEEQILGQKMLSYDNTLCYLLPGMLEYFDYEDLMR